MKLKQRLSEYRKAAGVSQEEAAEKLGVSRQTISRWENGQSVPSTENMAKLSGLYQVSLDALLRDNWTPPEPEIQTVEVPVEVRVEVPVLVEVPRPRNCRLLALLAALALAAGIFIGVFFFREHEDAVPAGELEGEVIGDISSVHIEMLPLDGGN